MLLEKTRRVLTRRNINWLKAQLQNHFESEQICFYSNLGEVSQFSYMLLSYLKICTHKVYTGVRTNGYNIPYKVQPPTRPQPPKRISCQSFRQNYYLSEIERVALRETGS